MRRRLAVVHHPRSFFALTLHGEISDAADIIWVLPHELDADPSARLLHRLGDVVEISGRDADEAAEALAAHRPDGIVTFVDDNLVLTAELAARLGLIYHSPEVAATLADKQQQREVMSAAGVAGPAFWPLPGGLSDAELRPLAAQIRFPAVLKPAAGSGSRGILALTDQQQLLDAYEPDVKLYVEEHMPDDPARDPRFASYLSVESVVDHGRTTHVAITGRFALAEPFRETGNFIPAAVTPAQTQPLLELASDAISALSIETGVLHTEIKLTPDGPKVIELNGRLGGRPPFVLQSVSDINLFGAARDLALGVPVELPQLAACRGIGYWRMLQPPTDAVRLRGVSGIDEALRDPHVDTVTLTRQPGEPVDWREGTDGRVVIVRGRVDDLDTLADEIGRIDRLIALDYERTEDGPGSLADDEVDSGPGAPAVA